MGFVGDELIVVPAVGVVGVGDVRDVGDGVLVGGVAAVAGEDGVLFADGVVDAKHSLEYLLPLYGNDLVVIAASKAAVRLREVLNKLRCYRVDTIGGNDVSCEGLAGDDLIALAVCADRCGGGVIDSDSVLREVTGFFSVSRRAGRGVIAA